MKHLLIAFLSLITLHSSAQVVSGLYSGTLFNDTLKMLQKYEVALSEYRGKITGYSYTTFVVNDTFYYGIRTVKAIKKDGNLIIEDDKMIVNNFPESPAKRVHRISTIPLTETDTITTLNGRWRTTATKVYYSVPGSLEARRDNDSSRSALISHLKELRLLPGDPSPAAVNNDVARTQSVTEKPVAKVVKPSPAAKTNPSTSNKAASAVNVPATIPYQERGNKVLETVAITGDSLTLSFYDNGVVDGDIISVYINGRNVIEKALLKEAAIKKTIPISPTEEGIQLLLVAESLGSIPPNTGLLIIQDGTNRFEVRFSADLQTNASILIRKKK
jgi:hypothetical protein